MSTNHFSESYPLNRRELLVHAAVAPWMGQVLFGAMDQDKLLTHQATGTRVGEVTETSAVIWTRLTASAERYQSSLQYVGRVTKEMRDHPEVTVPVDQLDGACPGMPGRIRVHYGLHEDLAEAQSTPWVDVEAKTDFIHQFQVTNLRPASVYYYSVETAGPSGTERHAAFRGRFETAPPVTSPSDLRFCVMTCQAFHDRDHVDGHNIYPSMLAQQPKFACLTGDLVYYDSERPRAFTAELARYHWQRMFSLPRLVDFTRQVSTYWLKDDHDTLSDDSSPGESLGDFTFSEGQVIFRQQAPIAAGPSYRTFRWGRDLQIWLTDGRDYRSPNDMPDGPEKTIWGAKQKTWFLKTVSESDATWKILISPTPLVGPDRPTKNDNHSNAGFQHEGDEIRAWLQKHVPHNFFVICGDRHWQYHSVHPKTGLQEFSAGAASDAHAGGTPGENKNYHQFHRVLGGFLSVTLTPTANQTSLTFRHHDVHGNVVYEFQAPTKSD